MDGAGTSRTVVVLEDDPVQSQVMALQLEAQGWAARCCGTAQEAMREIGELAGGPVTLLMDLNVPGMTPVEFCREARALASAVWIVGCSASQPGAEVRAALDHFLMKPLDRFELLDAVSSNESGPSPALAEPKAPEHRRALHAETFDNLARAMTPEMLRSLYSAFFIDAEQRLGAMQAAQTQGNADAMKFSAHTLKGASGMLGAQAVAQTALAIEQLGANAVAEAPPLLHELRHRLDQAQRTVREKLDTVSGNIAVVSPTAEAQERKNAK